MDEFFLEATPKTPRLYFNSETGEFEISGRSIPENSIEFYKPVINWLDHYIKTPNPLHPTGDQVRIFQYQLLEVSGRDFAKA